MAREGTLEWTQNYAYLFKNLITYSRFYYSIERWEIGGMSTVSIGMEVTCSQDRKTSSIKEGFRLYSYVLNVFILGGRDDVKP